MINKNIFKNIVTLTLKNKKAESEFQVYLNEQRTKYNKWFSGILLMISLVDIMFQNFVFEKIKLKIPLDVVYIRLCTSFVIASFSFIIFILGFFIDNKKFKIFVSFANYVLILFPFINFKDILLRGDYAEEEVIAIFRISENFIRIIMIMLDLAPFPEGLYFNLVLLSLVIIYKSVTKQYYFIFFYFLCVIVYLSISYFYTKSLKEKLLIDLQLKEQMKWYSNIFENTHAGFISFENCNKINIINNTLLEIISKNKEISEILTSSEEHEEQVKILHMTHSEQTAANINILKTNPEKVLKVMLKDIYNEFKEKSEDSNLISNSNFDLKQFINVIQSLYKNKEMNEKFLFIGYKDLEVEIRSESSENLITNFEKKKEIITLELYFRYREDYIKENYQGEILFYDISKVKKIEEKNAELKYKTMFLSKVSHEFKNPLICISELVHDFSENYKEEISRSPNMKMKESFKLLKQISSFSDYLLLLMKDLDLFARLHIREEIAIVNSIIDIYNIFQFNKELAEIFILKFNKDKDVKFIQENEVPDNVILITDEIKLKQILINLISNAIKFTNFGVIKLKAEKVENENLIKFEVSDTGIGLSDEQLQNLFQPFKMVSEEEAKFGSGLGLYIISQILKQLKSEISINSKIGEGTAISFCLPCQFEEGKENASDRTIQLPEDKISLVIEKTELPVREEEEEEGEEYGNIGIWIKPKPQTNESIIPSEIETFPQPEVQVESEILNKVEPLIPPPQPDCSYFIFVDDEHFTRKSSVRILKKAAQNLNKKIEVFDATDGIECLYLIYKLIKSGYRINAIVSDEFMNHMNGTLAAEVLKKTKNLNTERIPFFLLTAYPEIKSGYVYRILDKPLNIKEAESIINSSINN